jgi:putative transposase
MTIAMLNSPVQYFRFGMHDLIIVNGVQYRHVRQGPFGHTFCRVDNSEFHETFSHEQIGDLLVQERLVVKNGHFLPTRAHTIEMTHGVGWENLTEAQKAKVLWKQDYCDSFLIMEMNEPDRVSRSIHSMPGIIAEIYGQLAARHVKSAGAKSCGAAVVVRQPPSWTTLLRWLGRYERSGHDKMALLEGRRRSGNKTPRLAETVVELIRKHSHNYVRDNRKPTATGVWKDLLIELDGLNAQRAKQGLSAFPHPSDNAIRRKIRQENLFHVAAGRNGLDFARRKFALVQGEHRVTRPLERVEIDEWKANVHTIVERSELWDQLTPEEREDLRSRRCWVTYPIDVATRCILGLHVSLDAPSAVSGTTAIQMMLVDKTPIAHAAAGQTSWHMRGLPEQIISDGGAAYVNNVYETAVSALFAERTVGPAKTPWLRGTIERSFGTLDQTLMQYFPGRTFQNVVAKGDYDSQKNAALTVDELTLLIIRWIVDIYHLSPHDGLGGEMPYRAWDRLQKEYGVQPPPSADIQRHIFGLQLLKKIGNKGIHALGIDYQSTDLQLIRIAVGKRKVRVRIDRLDISRVSVEGPNGWITIDHNNKDLSGVSLSEWKAASDLLRRRHQKQAKLSWPVVGEAIRAIRARVDDAIKRVGLASPLMTEEDFAKLDRNLFGYFRIGEETWSASSEEDEFSEDSAEDGLDADDDGDEDVASSTDSASPYGKEADWSDE